jgi:hypothetical protein
VQQRRGRLLVALQHGVQAGGRRLLLLLLRLMWERLRQRPPAATLAEAAGARRAASHAEVAEGEAWEVEEGLGEAAAAQPRARSLPPAAPPNPRLARNALARHSVAVVAGEELWEGAALYAAEPGAAAARPGGLPRAPTERVERALARAALRASVAADGGDAARVASTSARLEAPRLAAEGGGLAGARPALNALPARSGAGLVDGLASPGAGQGGGLAAAAVVGCAACGCACGGGGEGGRARDADAAAAAPSSPRERANHLVQLRLLQVTEKGSCRSRRAPRVCACLARTRPPTCRVCLCGRDCGLLCVCRAPQSQLHRCQSSQAELQREVGSPRALFPSRSPGIALLLVAQARIYSSMARECCFRLLSVS